MASPPLSSPTSQNTSVPRLTCFLQGVPALFRWLSKKYPKIVSRVVEETPTKVRDETGEVVEVPLRYDGPNPNGFEVDNLYLDMNGIVHPCTHPEGKPAPETEEDMMVEIFKYTERVVNMARPRKVLMMAIDGVAPRAKMNQQRSRRFRAAQEAADKEEERREAIKLFEAMGHPVSEATKNQKGWDSNAITPGTPFMDLLSASLKYWVSYKLTNDPGWKNLKIIISDASVPGEGEHKIVDWIRRQRTNSEWDPNTTHAMYGLDADLIMLSLATHEPHFRVLREDVFAQGSKDPQACKNCGQQGHFAANCKNDKLIKDPNVVEVAKPVDPKPFIWLDVACLREYLTIELHVPQVPFPFDVELAIDDWIFLIFFVGNDFLPHLPSLEIREGAIDTLLHIWRMELPRMGGYLTNHGKVNLERAGIILEGLAKSEDEIFQKRKEDEERQNANQKRRRIEDHRRQDEEKAAREGGINGSRSANASAPGSMQMNGQDYVAVAPAETARGGRLHPSLPQRPGFDVVPKEQPAGKKLSYAQEAASLKAGLDMMQGSNEDLVNNRKKIRMANMSAAQALKAELEGGEEGGVQGDEEEKKEEEVVVVEQEDEEKEEMEVEKAKEVLELQGEDEGVDEEVVPVAIKSDEAAGEKEVVRPGDEEMQDVEGEEGPRGKKRKAGDEGDENGEEEDGEGDDAEEDGDGEGEGDGDGDGEGEDEGEDAPGNPEDQVVPKKKLKVNPDGTVDYEDEVRLWEPGYRERYYRAKFGLELSDRPAIDEITQHYMRGLCWVLEYYYQGVPAWDWYYPYHYAPFAQDFQNVGSMRIEFEPGEPFKPYAQLLGVFPAASRIHLPAPLQTLMTEEDSPILDFYPSDFEIDMNGKKMAWQGVALLPFIDQFRLLAALKSKEEELTEDEKRRNRWGDNIMFVAEGNGLYEPFCGLYTINAATKPVPIDPKLSLGTFGSVLSDPSCVPFAGLDSPLVDIPDCPDLTTNASLSVRYFFPRQAHKHRSVLLRGYKPPPALLTEADKDWTRRGGGGRGGRGGRGGGRGGGGGGGYGGPGRSQPSNLPRGGGGGQQSSLPRSNAYPVAPDLARYGVHSGPPPPGRSYGGSGGGGGGAGGYGGNGAGPGGYGGRGAYGSQPVYGGGASSYGGGASSYGANSANSAGAGAAYGAQGGAYGSGAYGYGGRGAAPSSGGYANPYASGPGASGARYGNAPPPPPTGAGYGYGGQGGQGGQGGYGGAQGGYGGAGGAGYGGYGGSGGAGNGGSRGGYSNPYANGRGGARRY